MFEVLRKHIESKVELTEEEFKSAVTYFTPKKLRKKQYLLQSGDFAKYLAFVSKGCLRTYSVDEKGEEYIVQFAIENWWISDMGFVNRQPAKYNIDALEDSELLLIDKDSHDKLCSAIPKLEHYFRILLENSNRASVDRIADFISASAEERYLKFINKYPEFVQRIPQNQIASYLGITPQSLSRIRKERTEKK